MAIRGQFSQLYRQEFEGKIYLPLFCVKNGGGQPERLDYYRHLISNVRVEDFNLTGIDWDLSAELKAAHDQHYRLTLGQEIMERVAEQEAALLESDDQVKRWLAANLDFPHYSLRQMLYLVERAIARLIARNAELAGQLGLVKFVLREKLVGFVESQTDEQTEAVFKRLFETKKLLFYLHARSAAFRFPAPSRFVPRRRSIIRTATACSARFSTTPTTT